MPLKKPLAILEKDEARAGEGGIAYKASARWMGWRRRPSCWRRAGSAQLRDRSAAAGAPVGAAADVPALAAGDGGHPQQVPVQDAAQAAHHQAAGPLTSAAAPTAYM
jgi:hypothetical protein